MARRKKDDQDKPKRRARGEGTVVKRADGRFVARVPLGGGKRKEEYYESRQEAERAKRRMLNERDAGKLVTGRDQTFEDYLLYWLEAHRVRIRETSHATYYTYLKSRVLPALGHVRLKKLTVEMFQSLYQQWEREQLAPGTIILLHSIMNTALGDAVKWRKLTNNPLKGVKLPQESETEVHVFSDEEITRLSQCAQEMRLYTLFRMALFLAMRLGELSGLKWSDIDFEKATLQIRRTVYYMRDPDTGHYRFHVGPPKTKAGERLIYLPQEMVKLLRQHRERQEQIRARAPRWANLDLVFCSRYGTHLHPNAIRRDFNKLLQKAGIEHMKFHGLRHNASLILRKLGIDPIVRKEMMGHSSLAMTDGIYGHTTSKMHEQAAQEIDRLLDGEEM